MRLFGKDLQQEVVYVAEVGVNHEGSIEAASNLLRLAAEAGADAVKFQSYTPDRYASASDPARLERVTSFALSEAEHRRLAAEGEELGVPVFSTPLTEDMVPLLDELFPAFKIASGDITFEPVIRAAAQTGKPIIISTGAATTSEIERAVSWVADGIGDVPLKDRLVLLQCTAAYPTAIEEANVAVVPELAKRFGVFSGYSNHVVGPDACLAAIALGARVVEVHFTNRREGKEFHDHKLSFEPSELTALMSAGGRIRSALGSAEKAPQESEKSIRELIHKGVMASRELAVGTVLAREDLMFARPANGIAATEVDTVIGRELSVALKKGEQIMPDSLS